MYVRAHVDVEALLCLLDHVFECRVGVARVHDYAPIGITVLCMQTRTQTSHSRVGHTPHSAPKHTFTAAAGIAVRMEEGDGARVPSPSHIRHE
jgi:hypothetical protein